MADYAPIQSSYSKERYRQELTLAVLQSDLASTLKNYNSKGKAAYIIELVDTIMEMQS